jgi:hypothetical protein
MAYAVLGTTNSTASTVSGNNFENTTEIVSVTIKALFETTTTQTTRPYTFSPVGQTTTQTTNYTTATSTDGPTTSSLQKTTTTLWTAAVQSTQSSYIATTTFLGSDINTPIYATVVQAEENEVLWVADTSAATDLSGIIAASQVAQSTTKTTIFPWTETFLAQSVDPQSTYTVSNAKIGGLLAHQVPIWSETVTTSVTYYEHLPHYTEMVEHRTPVSIVGATHEYTVREDQTLTIVGADQTLTLLASIPTTAIGFTAGSSYSLSQPTTITYTEIRQQKTAEVSTYTNSLTLFPFTSETNSTEEGLTYTITTYREMPQAICVFYDFAPSSRCYEGYFGVVGSNGEIAVGYSCNPNFGPIEKVVALCSRNVFSLFPSTFINDNGQNQLTVSGLSITYRPITETQTSSFVLETFGTPERNYFDAAEDNVLSGLKPGSLGASETIYKTTRRGVYWNGLTTQSFNNVASSYRSGSSFGWIEPISGISADTLPPPLQNQIYWTVSRNGHQGLNQLTQGGAYYDV